MRTALLSVLALLGCAAAQEHRPTADPEWARKYGIDLHANAAYFSFTEGHRGYVVALNVVKNGDVYFHMAGPVTSSWVGIGFGSRMQGSFMLVAYAAANGLNATISPRMGIGKTEPVYMPDVVIEKVYTDLYAPSANTVTNNGTGVINVHAICRKCASLGAGAIDLSNPAQEFFFALGPNKTLKSDSPSANLAKHDTYGQFTMDMPKAANATGDYGRVPGPNTPQFVYPPTDIAFADYGTSVAYNVHNTDNHNPGIHGFLMIVAFLIIFPFGALVKFVLHKVLWHAAIQTIGVLLVLGGFGVATRVAPLYIKSKNYNSGHQIIGMLTIAGLVIQFGLGFVHHSIYARTKRPTPLGVLHVFLGPIIMVLGVVNGGIGFRFAGYWEYNLVYGLVAGAIAIVFFGIVGCIFFMRNRRRTYKADVSYNMPAFGPDSSGYHDMDMRKPSVRPNFGEEPPTPYEPHTPFSPHPDFLPYEPPEPYAPVVPYTPYTPDSAYTPDTPKTFKKMEITEYPLRGDR